MHYVPMHDRQCLDCGADMQPSDNRVCPKCHRRQRGRVFARLHREGDAPDPPLETQYARIREIYEELKLTPSDVDPLDLSDIAAEQYMEELNREVERKRPTLPALARVREIYEKLKLTRSDMDPADLVSLAIKQYNDERDQNKKEQTPP